MRTHQALPFLLLFVITSGASESASTSRGCEMRTFSLSTCPCATWTPSGASMVEAVAGGWVP